METKSSLTTSNKNNESISLKSIAAANPATENNSHPDQKYIDALLNNNLPVLNELYAKFSGKVKSMILQNNGTEADAADILQDALLSIYQTAKTKNFVLSCPLDAFLYIACKNKWINKLKKRRSREETFTDTEKYENIGYDSFKEGNELGLQQARKELLMEKLAELGENSQKLLRLSWSGKSMEEVARILNVSYGYARKKKSEAMARLVKLVKDSSGFNDLRW